MSSSVALVAWVLLGVPAAIVVSSVGRRLLGERRSWLQRAISGTLGWTGGVLVAGEITGWAWSELRMVLLTLLFGTFLTMVCTVGIDMLAPPGSLLRSEDAGRIGILGPVRSVQTGITTIGRYRQLVAIARANGLLARHPRGDDPEGVATLGPALRRTLEAAGGIFVKLGQVASSRTDLLPPALCSELALLRSSVPPAPKDEAQPLIREQLGAPVADVFAEFDWEPIASASIAQVYAAVLHDGTPVVVKAERPGIGAVVDRDSAVIRQLAGALERHTSLGLAIKPTDLADEFIAGVREELDFGIEAANARALAAATPAGSGVRVPRTYDDLSTSKVLVEERIDGVTIADVATLVAQGHDPAELARRLCRVTLTQVFETGVFHADPHAGNILVEPDGTIVLIDLGAVGRLGHGQRQLFTELLAGVMTGDAVVVREALEDAALLDGTADRAEFESTLDQFLARRVGSGSSFDTSMIEEMLSMLSTFGLRPPRWLSTLGRTLVSLEGTLREVDPTFSLVDEAMAVVGERGRVPRPESLKAAMETEAVKQLPRLRRLPERVDQLLGQASRGQLTARVSMFADDDDLRAVTKLVDRGVLALLTASLGIGSALLLHAQAGPSLTGSVTMNEVLGYLGLAISTVLMLRLVASIIRDGVI